jgi:hypothetical protein
MGKSEGSSAESKADDLSSRQKEDRGGAAGTVGAGEDAAGEESALKALWVFACGRLGDTGWSH